MNGRTVRTAEKGERLLRQLALGNSIAAACKAEGIGRRTYYDWRDDDAEFAQAAADAIEHGTDRLEDEAKRRALKQSDTLLIFLLKARRPDTYKERVANEHTGKDGEALPILAIAVPLPTRDDGEDA